jgi:hypothetical protein
MSVDMYFIECSTERSYMKRQSHRDVRYFSEFTWQLLDTMRSSMNGLIPRKAIHFTLRPIREKKANYFSASGSIYLLRSLKLVTFHSK